MAVVAAVAMLVASPAPGVAQAYGTAPVETDYQRAFAEMMGDLSNPERSFRFAEAAVRAGDIRGAISALERILVLNPQLANIRLELGDLYYRVGNLELARQYLKEALQSPEAPPEVRARAERLLADSESGLSPHRISGSLLLAGRYDSNANAGPSAAVVRGGGVDLRLSPEFTKHEDASLLTLGTLQYAYDLGTQGGDRIEVNGTGFVSRYLTQNIVNLSLAQIDAGPWISLDETGSFAVRPLATAGTYYLEDTNYLDFYGAGTTLRRQIGPQLLAYLGYLYRRETFHNSPNRQVASDRSGNEHDLTFDLTYLIGQRDSIGFSLGGIRADARKDYEAYKEWIAALGYTLRHDAFGLVREPVSTTLLGRFRRAVYDAPNPFIDPGTTRRDDYKEISLLNSLPVGERLSVILNVQYLDVTSTLPNFAYDDVSVTLGIAWQF